MYEVIFSISFISITEPFPCKASERSIMLLPYLVVHNWSSLLIWSCMAPWSLKSCFFPKMGLTLSLAPIYYHRILTWVGLVEWGWWLLDSDVKTYKTSLWSKVAPAGTFQFSSQKLENWRKGVSIEISEHILEYSLALYLYAKAKVPCEERSIGWLLVPYRVWFACYSLSFLWNTSVTSYIICSWWTMIDNHEILKPVCELTKV